MIYKKSWKYILIKNSRYYLLYRIKALKNFSDVSKGDIGGYVSSYHNLSQSGNCWVYNNATIRGSAQVTKNACVYDYAVICDYVRVTDNAKVSGQSLIYRYAIIFGNANIKNQTLTEGFYK